MVLWFCGLMSDCNFNNNKKQFHTVSLWICSLPLPPCESNLVPIHFLWRLESLELLCINAVLLLACGARGFDDYDDDEDPLAPPLEDETFFFAFPSSV